MGHLRCVAGFGVRGLDGVVFALTISEKWIQRLSEAMLFVGKAFFLLYAWPWEFELCAICVPNVYSDI